MTKINRNYSIINTARWCTHISFMVGTLIFLLFAISGFTELMVAGLFYSVLAALANGLILFILLLHFISDKSSRKEIVYVALAMLCNIPIAIFYGWLAIQMATLMHIKL